MQSTGTHAETDLVALIQATHPPGRPSSGGQAAVPTAPKAEEVHGRQGPAESRNASAPSARERPVVVGSAETPVGFLSVGLTSRGVAACTFEPEDTVAARLARATSAQVGQDDKRIDPLRVELDRYFQGAAPSFDVRLDLRLLSAFGRAVLRAVRDVPYGSVTTHTALARRIGSPGALRAVRNSLLTNPLCVLLPCHRAVPEEYPSAIGEYVGPIAAKRYLLTLEELAQPSAATGRDEGS